MFLSLMESGSAWLIAGLPVVFLAYAWRQGVRLRQWRGRAERAEGILRDLRQGLLALNDAARDAARTLGKPHERGGERAKEKPQPVKARLEEGRKRGRKKGKKKRKKRK